MCVKGNTQNRCVKQEIRKREIRKKGRKKKLCKKEMLETETQGKIFAKGKYTKIYTDGVRQ